MLEKTNKSADAWRMLLVNLKNISETLDAAQEMDCVQMLPEDEALELLNELGEAIGHIENAVDFVESVLREGLENV